MSLSGIAFSNRRLRARTHHFRAARTPGRLWPMVRASTHPTGCGRAAADNTYVSVASLASLSMRAQSRAAMASAGAGQEPPTQTTLASRR